MRDRAVALACEKGTVSTIELTALGLWRTYITKLVREGSLERVERARYRVGNAHPKSSTSQAS